MPSLPLKNPTSLLDDLDFVRSLARQLCHTVHAAEDVAQATLATAIESPPAKLDNRRGWLATVARNLAHKHYRKEGRLKARELRATKSGTAPSTDEVVAREELRSSVVQAVLALPEPYRKIVLLRHFNGLDIAECAASLGIPESTARTHLSRAAERLRATLDRQHQGDRKAWMAALAPLALPTASTAHMVAVTAISSNKKAVLLLVAASLLVGWFAWPDSQVVTPPPGPLQGEPAVAGTESASDNDTNWQQRPLATQRDERQDATTAAKDPWTATGTVIDSEDDQGIAGAFVRVFATVGEQQYLGEQIAIGETITAADGTFSLPIGPLRALSQIVQSQVSVHASIDAVGYSTDIVTVMLRDILSKDENGTLDTNLTEEVLTKGRVVTTDGTPVRDARLLLFSDNGKQSFDAEFDGTFGIDLSNSGEADVYSLVAVHDRYGRSNVVAVYPKKQREHRLADLVLRPIGQRIEGFVHYPDGEPVADLDVSVYFDEGDDLPPVFLNGLEIEAFEESLQGLSETTTDDSGRFIYHNVRCGSYEIDVGSNLMQPLTVRAGQQVTHVDINYDVPHRAAQIEVLLEDQYGTWLPEAFYGVHTWKGPDAIRAQARFQSEGASTALMTTATEHDAMYAGSDRFLRATPDTFTIIESCFHDCGPTYGACLLRADQHRGKVHIVLSPRTATGSLQIDVRDADGETVTPLWVRMSRVPTRSGLPIPLPGMEATWAPPSDIPGLWYCVPNSGRIHGLPAGALTVEVLPGPEVVKGRLDRCPWPVLKHQVTIVEGDTANISDRTTVGIPLVVELQLPQVAPNERLIHSSIQVSLVPTTGGRLRYLNLRTLDGSGKVEFVDGHGTARSLSTFAPGTYEFRYSPNLSLQRLQPGDTQRKAKWQPQKTKWRIEQRVIELRVGMQPIAIKVERL